MITDSLLTGGVVAVALGAIEVAKIAVAKRNGKINVPAVLKAQDRTMRDLLAETREQTRTLDKICVILDRQGGVRQ